MGNSSFGRLIITAFFFACAMSSPLRASGQTPVRRPSPIPRPLATVPAASRAGAIVVLAPGRGTEWTAGSGQKVQWHKRGRLSPTVRVVLLRKGRPELAIAASVPNSGTFNWNIPATLGPGSYSLAVVTADGSVRGTSNPFRIVAPPSPGRPRAVRQLAPAQGPTLVMPGPPLAPTNLVVAARGSMQDGASYNYVGLMWHDQAINELGYVVERWGGPGCEAGYTVVGLLPANATFFEDVGVDPRAGTYWWSVKATNLGGPSAGAAISIQNDVRHNPVGGTQTVEVPEDPAEKCKAEGGVWLGWGINYCSKTLGDLYSAGQIVFDPIVQVYMGYFAIVGGGATTYRLPEDVVTKLKPHYGETLLREVRTGASNHTKSDSTAMTDCKNIYFPSGSGVVALLKSDSILEKRDGQFVYANEVRWLLHELQHTRQCVDIGGRENYAVRWFSELGATTIGNLIAAPGNVSSREIHDAMPMEEDATRKEDLVNSL